MYNKVIGVLYVTIGLLSTTQVGYMFLLFVQLFMDDNHWSVHKPSTHRSTGTCLLLVVIIFYLLTDTKFKKQTISNRHS